MYENYVNPIDPLAGKAIVSVVRNQYRRDNRASISYIPLLRQSEKSSRSAKALLACHFRR